ncbi:hypothetical protein U1Q18_052425 [Sarracenia purpurea var. burkii]
MNQTRKRNELNRNTELNQSIEPNRSTEPNQSTEPNRSTAPNWSNEPNQKMNRTGDPSSKSFKPRPGTFNPRLGIFSCDPEASTQIWKTQPGFKNKNPRTRIRTIDLRKQDEIEMIQIDKIIIIVGNKMKSL